MLDRETTVEWARALIAFINRAGPRQFPFQLTEKKKISPKVLKRLLANADEDVRRIAEGGNTVEQFVEFINRMKLPFQHRSAKHLEGLRSRAEETVRWLITREEIDDSIRRGIAADWLANSDVITSSDYNHVPLDATLDFDSNGRVVMRSPQVRSPEAFVGITLAELISPDCPIQVRACALESCNRLFIRVLKRRGQPRLCCSDAHAAKRRKQTYKYAHVEKTEKRRHK